MNNKLIPATIAGAVIGAAVSMIDKKTRSSVKNQVQATKQNGLTPAPATKSKVSNLKDELLYWKETIDEIRRNNPELEKALLDAKDTFIQKRNQKKLSGPNN
ncbi:YtxH domain-containing protein [Macrococcus capreoli]|uniref:YtxH domain-containing protein n=1 Tax=Macrococcus capreoli TaxID=2982690 RepID=UPI0021D5DC70|nr:YtxH domain-containing protein [Macrococcus sp. TMW 2.2395]MCU7557781.1 YtxH domain-containing protein [Macrococcus sp. TMW 2.2395]